MWTYTCATRYRQNYSRSCCSWKVTTPAPTTLRLMLTKIIEHYYIVSPLKSHVRWDKYVILNPACSKIPPPRITWNSADSVVWTRSLQNPQQFIGIFHRSLFLPLIAHLSDAFIYLSFSMLWTVDRFQMEHHQCQLYLICCDSCPVRDPMIGLRPCHINFLES